MALADAVPYAVAAWTLDETSGSRVDSVNGYNLTEYNTVGSAAGKLSNAAQFIKANTEFLRRNDNADLSGGAVDLCFRCWIYADSLSSGNTVFAKGATGALREYTLFIAFGNRLQFRVADSSATFHFVTTGSISTGTWYLVHCWHQNGVGLGISLNAGAPVTTTHTTGSRDTSFPFYIGATDGGYTWDGRVDDFVFLKNYILDATERTADYNGGSGVAFADWSAGGGGGTPSAGQLVNGGLVFA
jgi:hypothetical protein